VKTLAYVIGLFIASVGIVGLIVPSFLVWIAGHFVSSGAFYVVAVVRVAVGLLLFSVAPDTRAPRTIRVLGCLLVIAGIGAAVTALVAIGRASAIIDWWLRQGSGVVRLTGIPLIILGGFVAYVCAPSRRSA
jgi:hypothetical protein